MLSTDQFVLEKSHAPLENEYLFENKQYIYVPDGQNGSYATPQVTFECTQLTNCDRFVDFSQAFITIPLVMVLSGTNPGSVVNAFAMSLKNGYHQLINSMQIQISNNDVVTLSNLANMKINYEIISTWSNDTLTQLGPSVGVHGLDSWQSFQYAPVGTGIATGLGEINNLIKPSDQFVTTGGYLGTANFANQGRQNRMVYNTSFDPASGANPFLLSAANAGLLGKNYVTQTNTQVTYYILATIPLRIINDIFSKIQLTKGIYLKLVLNLHTHCQVQLTTAATQYNTAYTTSSVNNVVPFQLSQIDATGGFSASAAQAYTATIGIANSYGNVNTASSHPTMRQCRLYAATYKMSPQVEDAYLRAVPQKTILYNDFFTYSSQCLNVAPGSQINPILNYGASRLRGLLIVPQLASTVNGVAVANLTATTGGTLGSPLMSPFSSSPGTCAPWARVSNFNVIISGTPWFQQNINYGFEHFLNEVRKGGAYGGMLPQISSGLIGQSDWEAGYGFIYVNLDRWANQALDNAPKSVQIQLTNSASYTCDYYVFLIYQREVTISTTSGQLVI
jgi:hypothetical protein